MKRLIRSSQETYPTFNIEVFTDHPFLHPELYNKLVAAVDINKLPDSPVIAKDKERVTQWMIDDFESFVEMVEDLCEDTYGLTCTYKNVSPDHSHYYDYLAKDSNGNILARFILRLRISNHDAKRTPQQKKNKKTEWLSEKLHELLSEKQIRNIRKYPMLVTVNDSLYESYIDAFNDIEQELDHHVQVMKGLK